MTAVSALTGDLRLFDRDSGVALVDAVAGSCAVPMVWPPVTIGGIRYVNNLDLAAGYERVLLIAPMDDPRLAVGIAAVENGGGRVQVINPDEASPAAFGTDPLDPSTRTPSADAGLALGKAAVAKIAPFWA
ncbi:hypothetical protein [Actinomadura bangladeshensis]|uniref:Uncharacterized protein n=1 Tax=Actinomadura bangladeshensis TaxID=453573 RepID=A0A4R4N6G9_9ACTN|nr:hypothetical protein [Actinomadura bangladeshensis]TDC02853.1 hypothetical protein E1284_39075 [Actinomadura bangladeshensis]